MVCAYSTCVTSIAFLKTNQVPEDIKKAEAFNKLIRKQKLGISCTKGLMVYPICCAQNTINALELELAFTAKYKEPIKRTINKRSLI